ncbi:hypothetical protein GCM10023196_007090 [Actinoallomurus vinaceus]|uniref:Uncharacterized protein n=1 Tax=Actinoallomurus vinaceus TaxID=1080074 RepID=A0ABP8U310_9ACTN
MAWGPTTALVSSSRLPTGVAAAIRAGVQYALISAALWSKWLTACTVPPPPTAAMAGGTVMENTDAVSSAPWRSRLILTDPNFHDRKQYDDALFHDH